jgi:HAD superfamily hydrolase (TIGR01549 family)
MGDWSRSCAPTCSLRWARYSGAVPEPSMEGSLQPYLLLDAGGTIVFPDFRLFREVLLTQGVDIDEERLKRIGTEWIKRLDELLRQRQDPSSLKDFLEDVLERTEVPQASIPALLTQLQEMDRRQSLWSATYPWVGLALERLCRAGLRASVISNADGRVAQQLERLGFLRYFEQVFDSRIVGYEKPDVRLFQHALQRLGLRPEECLFVGDVYYIDVLGANRAGIAAVHLDPYGLYSGWEGCHIPSIGALPDLLANPDLDLRDDLFFPLREA